MDQFNEIEPLRPSMFLPFWIICIVEIFDSIEAMGLPNHLASSCKPRTVTKKLVKIIQVYIGNRRLIGSFSVGKSSTFMWMLRRLEVGLLSGICTFIEFYIILWYAWFQANNQSFGCVEKDLWSAFSGLIVDRNFRLKFRSVFWFF